MGIFFLILFLLRTANLKPCPALPTDTENNPLQPKSTMNILVELIAWSSSLHLWFGPLCSSEQEICNGESVPVRFRNPHSDMPLHSSIEGMPTRMTFIQIIIISVTLVVVAVPDGKSWFGIETLLPLTPNIGLLAVTLALAFVTKCMTKENLLIRVLGHVNRWQTWMLHLYWQDWQAHSECHVWHCWLHRCRVRLLSWPEPIPHECSRWLPDGEVRSILYNSDLYLLLSVIWFPSDDSCVTWSSLVLLVLKIPSALASGHRLSQGWHHCQDVYCGQCPYSAYCPSLQYLPNTFPSYMWDKIKYCESKDCRRVSK